MIETGSRRILRIGGEGFQAKFVPIPWLTVYGRVPIGPSSPIEQMPCEKVGIIAVDRIIRRTRERSRTFRHCSINLPPKDAAYPVGNCDGSGKIALSPLILLDSSMEI